MGYLFQVLFLGKLFVDFFITWSLRMVEVGTDEIPDLGIASNNNLPTLSFKKGHEFLSKVLPSTLNFKKKLERTDLLLLAPVTGSKATLPGPVTTRLQTNI